MDNNEEKSSDQPMLIDISDRSEAELFKELRKTFFNGPCSKHMAELRGPIVVVRFIVQANFKAKNIDRVVGATQWKARKKKSED